MNAYVVVSGLPGSGKTTLARALAAELKVALLAKDAIKEALFDSLGTGDVAWSKRLGGASTAVLLALAAQQERAVLESFWDPDRVRHELAALGAVIEVFCACDAATARRRYAHRAATVEPGARHPGHLDHERIADFDTWLACGRGEPLRLGGPLIEVRTDDDADVTGPARIAAYVRRQHRWARPRRGADRLEPGPDG